MGDVTDTILPKQSPIAKERETIPRTRSKLNSLPLQGIKRISLDSKIPNIVNIEASPKLSNLSDNEDIEEGAQDSCPNIVRTTNNSRKFNTDTPALVPVHNKDLLGCLAEDNLEDF